MVLAGTKHTPSNDRRHVLITGGPRALAALLASRLANELPQITVLGTFPARSREWRELVKGDRVTFMQSNLADVALGDWNQEVLESVTDLVHSDAVVEEPISYGAAAIGMVRANVVGAIYLIRHLPRLQQICYLSSVEVYGQPHIVPCSETHLAAPITLRGMAQIAVENFFRLHARRVGLGLLVLRLSSVYGFADGEEDVQDMIATVLRLFLSQEPSHLNRSSRVWRDYVHVVDVVETIVRLVRTRESGLYNIASGRSYSLFDVVQQAARVAGISLEQLIEEVDEAGDKAGPYCSYDVSKARADFNFAPRIPLEEGMQTLYSTLREATPGVSQAFGE